jgi:hypothetical protein
MIGQEVAKVLRPKSGLGDIVAFGDQRRLDLLPSRVFS